MNSKTRLRFLLLATPLVSTAPGATLFSSGFDGNTGATVLAGNTDNVSGSATVTINDWVLDPSVTAISALTAISSDDGGATTVGGFAQLQNGTATYAGPNNLFLSRNHNVDTTRDDNLRGFSLTFTLDSTWQLDSLAVRSGHTNNSGAQDQSFPSDLVINLSGGTLGAAVLASVREDYNLTPAYHDVVFNLTGTTLGAGTYTLQVHQKNMVDGGAYAIYDGIALDAVPEPSAALLTGIAGLGLLVRRRR